MEWLEQIQRDSTPVQVHWRSFELRPKDAPPPAPEYLALIQAKRPQLYSMARERYGLEMNPGPFGIDSRPALTGAKYAEEIGVGAAYQRAVMRAYWQEARDIGDRQVLAELAEDVGLVQGSFLAALSQERYRSEVDEDIATARAYGLNAVPAMVFADKYLVSGAQPLEVLQQVVAEVAAKESNQNSA